MPKEKVRFVKYSKQARKDAKSGDKWISMEGSKSKDMSKKKAERKQRKGKGHISHKYGDSPAMKKEKDVIFRCKDKRIQSTSKKIRGFSCKKRRKKKECI